MSEDKTKYLEKWIVKNLDASDFLNRPMYRIPRPMKPFRAKTLGCKTKPGYIYVIYRIKKGGLDPQTPSRGRKPSRINQRLSRNISKKDICCNRVLRNYRNMQLVGSYKVFENGKYTWYQIILKQKNV